MSVVSPPRPRTTSASAPSRRPAPVPPPPPPGGRRRVAFLVVTVLLALAVCAGRLVWLQVIQGPSLAQEAKKSRLTTVSVLGNRGQIVDADGVVLASSVERYDISVNQLLVPEFEGTNGVSDGAVGVAQTLAPILDMNSAELGGDLVGTRQFKYLKKSVLPDVARQIRALKIPGINVDKVSERVYPNGSLAGNIIGFVNSNGQGLQGLESSENDELSGTSGTETYERGSKGQPIPGGYRDATDATSGSSATLTIDSDIQWKAKDALDRAVASSGASGGTVIVERPSTGEILALADSATIDPNNPGDSAGGALSSAVTDVFEPGSTGKVVTMAAALEEGVVTPTSPFQVADRLTTATGETFKDSHDHGVEQLTATGILAESSNTGTIQIGTQLTPETRYEYLRKFGFGSTTGIEMPGESAGIVHAPEDWYGRDQYAVLFGQALSVTAIQATQVYATIANGGVRVQPHLIAGWTAPDGTYTPVDEGSGTRVVSQQTADTVLQMLESVVDDGTGSKAAISGYRVAGKTGTAQNWFNGSSQSITASFIGVAPADDPQVVVSVILHNPSSSIYGGTVAAPVFAEVASYALTELGVAPSGTAATLFPTTW